MDDALTPAQVLEVLAAVNPGRSGRWQGKLRAVAAIGRHPDGAQVPHRDLATYLGCDRRYAQRLLRELVADGVLEVLELGTGSRAATYRLRPDVREWQGVPWACPAELVWLRLFHGEHLSRHETPAMARKASAPLGRLVARKASAPRAGVVARQASAPQPKSLGAHGSAPQSSARHRGVLSGSVGPERSGVDQPLSQAAPGAEREGTAAPPDAPTEVRQAVRRAAGVPFLEGAPRRRLAELVATHGATAVLEAAAEVPATGGAPSYVAALEDHLAGGLPDGLADLGGEPRPIGPTRLLTPCPSCEWTGYEAPTCAVCGATEELALEA